MLARDEKLVKEFKAQLADSTFARDAFRRINFFYTRSPWADPEQNFLPVCRALRRPPESVLAP
jgi:hypothetical protein